MKPDIDLTDRLRRLSSCLPRAASQPVEDRLIDRYRSTHLRRRTLWPYAISALLCLACALGWIAAGRRSTVVAHRDEPPAFIALPYAQSGVPLESAVVIRVRMGRSQLSSFGLPALSGMSAGTVQADLLVGQDGVPRAIRLVQ